MSRVGPHGPTFRQPNETPKADPKEVAGQGGGAGAAHGAAAAVNRRIANVAEAEALASQSGFVRAGKKRRSIDMGDSSESAIPLPQDDLEGIELDHSGLEGAEGALLRHTHALARGRARREGKQGLLALWQAIIGDQGEDENDDDGDDEERRADRALALQQLQSEPPPDAEGLATLRESMQAHFGVDMAEAPVGPQLMAASLLVAGMQQDVQAAPGSAEGVDAQRLFDGASRMIDAGRQAAEDARTRAETTAKHIALQRTFVPKR